MIPHNAVYKSPIIPGRYNAKNPKLSQVHQREYRRTWATIESLATSSKTFGPGAAKLVNAYTALISQRQPGWCGADGLVMTRALDLTIAKAISVGINRRKLETLAMLIL